MKIYVVRNEQQLGPFDEEELAREIQRSTVSYKDLAWVEGLASWQPLHEIAASGRVHLPSPPPLPAIGLKLALEPLSPEQGGKSADDEPVKQKSLILAICLNVLLPGLGLIYFGQLRDGCVRLVVSMIQIWFLVKFVHIGIEWGLLLINLVMLRELLKCYNAMTKKKCPSCAERVQREAKTCRYCHAKL